MRTKLHLASLFLLVEACALAQLAPCASGLYAIAPPGTAGQVALSCVVFPAAPAAKDDALMSDGKAGLVYTDGKGRAVKAWVGAGLFISPQSDGTVFLNNSGVAGHTCSGPQLRTFARIKKRRPCAPGTYSPKISGTFLTPSVATKL